jgi:hypothetical protein
VSDLNSVFVALCERVVEMGYPGPLGVLEQSMQVVCAAYRGEEWAIKDIAENPAWKLTDEGQLP